METHPAKRVEIIIEAPAERRLTKALRGAGVTGYSVLPVLKGAGRAGEWTQAGQVSDAGRMVMVLCMVRADKLDALLDAAFAVVQRQVGVVSITDCHVLRPERF